MVEGAIKNRVAESQLRTFDLEDFYPSGRRVLFDIEQWLEHGFILKEKDFREHCEQHPWEDYQDAYVALYCSTDAIVPTWAYMLLTTKLSPYAKLVVHGSLEDLDSLLYSRIIADLDLSDYKDKPVIVKGCSNKPVPENAYLQITARLQSVARSVMYGEACSSVPLFKKKK